MCSPRSGYEWGIQVHNDTQPIDTSCNAIPTRDDAVANNYLKNDLTPVPIPAMLAENVALPDSRAASRFACGRIPMSDLTLAHEAGRTNLVDEIGGCCRRIRDRVVKELEPVFALVERISVVTELISGVGRLSPNDLIPLRRFDRACRSKSFSHFLLRTLWTGESVVNVFRPRDRCLSAEPRVEGRNDDGRVGRRCRRDDGRAVGRHRGRVGGAAVAQRCLQDYADWVNRLDEVAYGIKIDLARFVGPKRASAHLPSQRKAQKRTK